MQVFRSLHAYTHIKSAKRTQRGFTLIELVVTVGIMAVITAVTLANHSKIGGKVMLRNLAYEIALVVREAQTYGVSVRKSGQATDFAAGYGMHFDAHTNKQYVMFTDVRRADGGHGGDGLYTAPEELVTTYTIGRGYTIDKIYATDNAGREVDADECLTGKAVVDILFKRPEPDAQIRLCGDVSKLYTNAKIVLQSPRGDKMAVLVEVSGQISVVKR